MIWWMVHLQKKDAYEKDKWQMVHLPQTKMHKKKMGVWRMVHLPKSKDLYKRMRMVHLPEKKDGGLTNGTSAMNKILIWK